MKMNIFSKEEIRDLAISIAALTLIFSFNPLPNFGINYKMLPYYFIIIVTAFFLHEMAHKFTAMKFGCLAFYRMWPSGIFFGLILMLVGIPFVAPGAVVIYPYFFGRWGYRIKTLTVNENGIISVSGPATNLLMALIFSLFVGKWMVYDIDMFKQLTFINAWLAFFNLLPIPPLDGSKVMQWRIWIWGLLIALSVLLIAFNIRMF